MKQGINKRINLCCSLGFTMLLQVHHCNKCTDMCLKEIIMQFPRLYVVTVKVVIFFASFIIPDRNIKILPKT